MLHCGEYMYFKTRTWASLAESYVVVFMRKWVPADQRSERCFSHLKTRKHPIRIANDVLSRERKMIGAIKKPLTEVCEFRAKISAFYRRLQLAAPSLCELLRRHSANKDLLKFLLLKVKNISEIATRLEYFFRLHYRWRKLKRAGKTVAEEEKQNKTY